MQVVLNETIEVEAIKPYSSQDKQNYVVIRKWNEATPYVVHNYNAETGGFTNGAYVDKWERAIEVFNQRGVR